MSIEIRDLTPTEGSYVVSQLQIDRKAGETHEVERVRTKIFRDGRRRAWKLQITASPAGHAYVRGLVAEVRRMAEEQGWQN